MSDKHIGLSANQSILGYLLRERIGSGGFGEVWSAEAPGGMLKAVKFVYGYHDENRAQRELKALDRIKHIRHPFLLSLERIDVVDGRLVVITELAERCLKARFTECRQQRLSGIPRDELLQYVRETADALDFIADQHGLAHLDIKPENLLLVGGHAKVADFGLVKELQATNQSLMESLTPRYAAPELFDGRPGRASDQYALAIVYQEMLTDCRPFPGSTTAQLANQHLHSWPNLNPLPRSDQAVIARALAKDPEKRFPDCRSLADELCKRRSRTRPVAVDGSQHRSPSASAGQETREMNTDQPEPDERQSSSLPDVTAEGPLHRAAPLSIDESRAAVRPTLFVGVGQSGIQVLRKLRHKLAVRYGSVDQLPAFRFLCLDVDRKTLLDATRGPESGAIENHELLHLPLRKAEQYRNDKGLNLDWIGRRWIFNIPRSQLTESLRPLGRLALVDNREPLFQRLGKELSRLARAENLAVTAETTELEPSDQSPQVIVVASTAGGLGSGMLPDLAYGIRTAMNEQGLADEGVYALALHSTASRLTDPRLSVANSYCFLRELAHYSLNGYPGCQGCGIPEFENTTPGFDRTWFVPLGDDLNESAWHHTLDGLAWYLFTRTATRATAFFAALGEPDDVEPGLLDSLGVGYSGQGEAPLPDGPAVRLADAFLKSWVESAETEEMQARYRPRADQILATTDLESSRLDASIRARLIEQFGNDPTRFLTRRLREALASPVRDGERCAFATAATMIDRLLGQPDTGPFEKVAGRAPADAPESATDLCIRHLADCGEKNRQVLYDVVFNLLNDPAQRLYGARKLTDEMLELLRLMSKSLESSCQRLETRIGSLASRYQEIVETGSPEERTNACWACLAEMVESRVSHLVECCKRWQIELARVDLTGLSRILEQRVKEIEAARTSIAQTGPPLPGTGGKPSPDTIHGLVTAWAMQQAAALVPDLAERFAAEVLEPAGGLRRILSGQGAWTPDLTGPLLAVASKVINNLLQTVNIDELAGAAHVDTTRLANDFEQLGQFATPDLVRCGGVCRSLIVVPSRAPVTSIAGVVERQLEIKATVVPATCGQIGVCVEMEQIPGEHVAMSLVQSCPDCGELIKRLFSRIDVQWAELTPIS